MTFTPPLRAAAALVTAALLVTCASDPSVRWGDVTLDLPDGWVVAEEGEDRLSLATAPFGQDTPPEDLEAALFLTREPGTSAADWRGLIERIHGEVEEDRQRTVGGAPATELVFRHDGNGTPLREMAVVVPARQLVILAQPVVARGEQDGPARFDRYRATFDAVLSSIRFGAPTDRARR
ncbi:MAG TPA: hypothetical protein VHF25_14325 [Nitriliruptorales bacterium]|nr:hypothetical protein [Nitriliruptorales bacterium]